MLTLSLKNLPEKLRYDTIKEFNVDSKAALLQYFTTIQCYGGMIPWTRCLFLWFLPTAGWVRWSQMWQSRGKLSAPSGRTWTWLCAASWRLEDLQWSRGSTRRLTCINSSHCTWPHHSSRGNHWLTGSTIWNHSKGKGKGRTLDIALQVDIATTKALMYMARTKQRHTYLPYTFPAIAGTHLLTLRGWRVK